MKKNLKTALLLLLATSFFACQNQVNKQKKENKPIAEVKLDSLVNIWHLSPDNKEIIWTVKQKNHLDHLEFSGLMVSGIIRYGVQNGNLYLREKVVWPMLRTIPNITQASLIHIFDQTVPLKVNGRPIPPEKPYQISFNGILTLQSHAGTIDIKRVLSPSIDKPAIVEQITLVNTGKSRKKITVGKLNYIYKTPKNKGVYGVYTIQTYNTGAGNITLRPGEKYTFSQLFIATKVSQHFHLDASREIQKRQAFIDSVNSRLILQTPDRILNRMFAFAKLRGVESIFATKGGLMHGPGGGRYYAAIWANDQGEYINPFFPFLGMKNGNESAINSYRWFAKYMNPEYKPIPSSIIAEGTGIWNGAGDRGDAAMLAYGASCFALAYGKKSTADSLLPLIKWCLTYCEKKMLPEGVIASDCDELEGRFPAGKANLSTNMLAYGGFLSAADLLDALHEDPVLARSYRQKAAALRKACNRYFGATVQGFHTYRYYKGNTKLRSWICFPLTMGVYDRKEGTIRALLSDKLWSENGILTQAGDSVYWDRATLIALRGILKAGETNIGLKYLEYYSQKRLLGNHVPYAVEAWPEGNQAQLSAESGLYCRTIIEGLFGITPVGLHAFTCAPHLPDNWNYMNLDKIKAFNTTFDLRVKRIKNGEEITVAEKGKPEKKIIWNGKSPVKIIL
ncbi:hypothetical protein LA303_01295 [Candidatus Sulfidibacterium hydrothermale]|uniref:hypothetical protein n=1 Tax=Candidatus Sulfidibacterium hydrothermale TaxID=2875962 RepID=UPI001F0AE450|nr:hypothetical protein [Candidatus Sulfidibacterium hydrothermale]UBM62627.1 hypothetical protein LA303_01295 [Candidatus Sulfidibacterium hydrothermale]